MGACGGTLLPTFRAPNLVRLPPDCRTREGEPIIARGYHSMVASRMPQLYKTVYFADHPAERSSQRNLTLAFGERDTELFHVLETKSSYEVRSLLGHHSFAELRQAADETGLPLNTYCRAVLREWLALRGARQPQLPLPLGDNVLTLQGDLATFQLAKNRPLGRWYPWIEGYSPEFVTRILDKYAPDAARILDPFAGVGTTPLAAAGRGIECFYCELSPLLQLLIDAKLYSLALPERERPVQAAAIIQLAQQLPSLIASAPVADDLVASYAAVFGASRFFDDSTFESVVRARTIADQAARESRVHGALVAVAAVSSLIPSSRLVRAGDLRYRRIAEVSRVQEFAAVFRTQLNFIAEDLMNVGSISRAPVMVASDARSLGNLPAMGLDAVITSPPYLNGTNYFRNTKLELWFLRAIRSASDLRRLRTAAVTAGINDVNKEKRSSTSEQVELIACKLAEVAYDRRIPQMVRQYFGDIEQIIRGTVRHLRPGAMVAIDIGDSIYAGVKVPTDDLILDLAGREGLVLAERVPLRTRISRNGDRIGQVLLVLHYAGKRPVAQSNGNHLPSSWLEFKSGLPHQKPPFSKRNWGHPLHSLCSYQGKLKPAIAAHLVAAFAPVGGRMLDPFAGVGTIPFEAALQGTRAFGIELSPAAAVIAESKLRVPSETDVDETLARLERFLTCERVSDTERISSTKFGFNGPINAYFDPSTLDEVILARRFFMQNPPSSAGSCLVLSSMLHILHGNRPYSLSRRSHPITPFSPTGPSEYRALLPRLKAKVTRSVASARPDQFVEGKIFQQDATAHWPQEIEKLDAVITSPPFFDSTRFYLANWMRLWFAGWEDPDFAWRPQMFLDERQKLNMNVYESVFRQSRERLRAGGVMVLHLGQSRKCDMASEMEKIAAPWFRVADKFVENVEHCESHGVRDKGTVTDHQYLVLV